MGVTLQAGILASCVVFVPMAMAGWHLTRNRVLFFSGALFIVLAVSVHVFPYFPVLSFNTYAESTSENNPSFKYDCTSNINQVKFMELASPQVDVITEKGVLSNDSDWDRWDWNWEEEPLHECLFQKLDREEALQLLQGTWIVFAGDSQARLLFVALLELLLPSIEDLRPQLFKRHSNFEYMLDSQHMRLDFIWAPYTVNLTEMVRELRRNQTYPDVLVMGAGLWHMLHAGNYSQYGLSLFKLERTVASLEKSYKELADKDVPNPQIFWMNLPTLIPSRLLSEAKRRRLTTHNLHMYAVELLKSGLLKLEMVTQLNIEALSFRCGPQCTHDGIHYSQAVYRTALHVMINDLLIVTKQIPLS